MGKVRLGLAVSGGADSTALLALLAPLRRELGFTAVVLHVDHALRADSAADAAFVTRLARRFRLPIRVCRARVVRRKGESLEMAARRVRLAFFARMTRELALDAIATGHHADDVAETFLMRLARGSGADGLAGLKRLSRVDGITFVRPLLDCRDADLRAYLTARGIGWREDSTNADTSILRNRVRHEILPYLREHLDPRMTEHIVKTAKILRGELTRPAEGTPPVPAADGLPAERPSFRLTLSETTGFERTVGVVGRLPATAYFGAAALAGRTLAVRTRRDGDRIAPVGMGGASRKLQDVYVTAKVPRAVRDALPIVADAVTGEVLWVPGYRVAESVRVPSPDARSYRFLLECEEGAKYGKTVGR